MDDLTWTLKQLCRRNRDGSFATQADRQRSLTLMARQLRDAGFNQMQARSLKGNVVFRRRLHQFTGLAAVCA